MDEFHTADAQLLELRQIIDEAGRPLLRIKIIDGVKFRHFDLDAATASAVASALALWAEAAPAPKS